MSILLVITVGQSDVQLVKDGARHELDKRCVGALHDAFMARGFNVVAAPAVKAPVPIETFSPEGTWPLCTPKLDAILDWAELGTLSRVLLLETTRRNEASDPRHAGDVLAQRLRDGGLDAGKVRRCAYLGPDSERLEDRENDEDAIMRRAIVTRIESCIREATRGMSRIVVAATGGMPEIKALVPALVRLHASPGTEIIPINVSDGSDDAAPDIAYAREPLDPVEVARAKTHALDLIENGNLLGAWGAVSHLANVPGQAWAKPIRWLGQFASSLPLDDACDFEILRHQRLAVRTALRVELALRADDIPRAVQATVAFFEAALWDKLGEYVDRSSHPKKRRQYRFKADAKQPNKKLVHQGGGTSDDRKRPFEFKEQLDGIDWYWIHDSEVCAVQIAKHYLSSKNLTELGQAVNSKVRELRNDASHSDPTPDLMDEACNRMRSAKLWSNDKTFLSQPLVQNVLTELGVNNPENMLDDLLEQIRARLLMPQT